MQQPAGLYKRGEIWHIDKVVTVGRVRKSLRQSTGCREISDAKLIFDRLIAKTKEEILYGPERLEHSFREAAVQYVLSIERRGKDATRAKQDLRLLDPYIGELPISHIHQGAFMGFESDQYGVRRSSTIARAYRTAVAALNYAARVLRDGNIPWLASAPPTITAPDWKDQLPPYHLDWTEQDRLARQMEKKTARHLIAPMLFGINCGAREQEICALRWEYEVLTPELPKGAVWWVPPEIRKGNSKRAASKQSGRYLVCNAAARSVIDGQRENRSDLVFPGPDGSQIGRLNNSGWRTAWKKAGFPTEGVKRGVHNLRHTFGARMEAAGIPWEYRKVLLGHEIQDVTAHYSPPGLARLLEEAEKVQRGTTVVLRPVPQITHSEEKRRDTKAANSLI
ncbi:MAG: tyrosine-type recombinase/integrase [Candidatus Thiodiazotropha sp. (ex Epidulcina cf. delphinae)]|nr:tyrosine-type recombinase/integrase [Candidatus Thiodiazotropha sp. (ex Epidulcina cf. delphinae)]